MNYYVSASGNDSNPGTIGQPWKSMAKVNATHLYPGDSVLFNRGDTFRGYLHIDWSGSLGNPITMDSYGSGNKPRLWGSKDFSSSSLWVNYSGNIWCTTIEVTTWTDVANLVFGTYQDHWGVKKTSLGGCISQYDWYINPSDSLVYTYSVSNPGIYYSHIEIAGCYIDGNNQEVIKLDEADYIYIRNLDVRFSPNNGILFAYGCTGGLVEYCDVSWIGGMYVPSEYPTRMGNGIGVWQGGIDITIRYNRIDQCYDAGISPQGGDGYSEDNIQQYGNIITNCYYSYEWFTRDPNTFNNVNFFNNTCIWAGSQWSQDQRPDNSAAEHIRNADSNPASIANCHIVNNIFCISEKQGHEFSLRSGIELNYNLYFVNIVGKDNPGPNTYVTLADWQAAFGYDLNSISADPDLQSDFTLAAGSPAINDGLQSILTDQGVSVDYAGHSFHNPPSIGALEYQGTTPITIPVTSVTVNCGAAIIDTDAGTLQMTASVLPVDATDQAIVWSVIFGTGTATISGTGLLTAITDGDVTVRATAHDGSGEYDECVVTISNQLNLPVGTKSLVNSGWHIPTLTEWQDLIAYLGGVAVAGGHLKEIGFVHWNSPNPADNNSGFTFLGAGDRNEIGIFHDLLRFGIIWLSTVEDLNNTYAGFAEDINTEGNYDFFLNNFGLSVRAIKDDSNDPGYYQDIDGNYYPTIKIGNQVWMKANLKVTHFTDGTPIPEVTADAAWAALTTAARCWYNNIPG